MAWAEIAKSYQSTPGQETGNCASGETENQVGGRATPARYWGAEGMIRSSETWIPTLENANPLIQLDSRILRVPVELWPIGKLNL